jgi:hypothetical protein
MVCFERAGPPVGALVDALVDVLFWISDLDRGFESRAAALHWDGSGRGARCA